VSRQDTLNEFSRKVFFRTQWLVRLRFSRNGCRLPALPSVNPPQPAFGQIDATDHARWFAEQVQPHEPALRAFLRGRFPRLADVDDLVQETYARVLRARSAGQLREVRPYLFATARNAAIDILRHQKASMTDAIGNIERLPVVEERPDAAEKFSHEQELAILHEAIAALPPRCREILTLRRFHDLSHREIGARLGISANTVDAQLCLAVFRCRQFLLVRGVTRERLARASPSMNH